MKPFWRVKRRPTGVSYFRDTFPYLDAFTMGGTMWTSNRKQAMTIPTLAAARRILRRVRSGGDMAIVIVRVTPSGSVGQR